METRFAAMAVVIKRKVAVIAGRHAWRGGGSCRSGNRAGMSLAVAWGGCDELIRRREEGVMVAARV